MLITNRINISLKHCAVFGQKKEGDAQVNGGVWICNGVIRCSQMHEIIANVVLYGYLDVIRPSL